MSETEGLMWTVEKDPSLRSDFVNITLLDGNPDADRMRTKVEVAVDRLPRLRQKVVSAPLRLVPPQWADDPEFDLDFHVRRVALPAPGGLRQLLDFAALVAMSPFDRARPLWEFVVVEGLDDGRAALLQKLHHTVTDGVGGLRLSLELLDLEREPSATAPPLAPADPDRDDAGAATGPRGPFDVVVEALADAARRQSGVARNVVRAATEVARHPAEIPQRAASAVAAARSLREQALVTGSAFSPLMSERSLARRFEAYSVPLEAVKAAAKAVGGTVNDAFVAGVAGAVGRYHERMSAPVEALRMAMPVNLRSAGDGVGGNHFAPMRMVVPVGPKDPRVLLEAIRDALGGTRSEPALRLADPLAAAVSVLPTAVLVPFAKAQVRTVDFATSNLRGSPVELFLAGTRIVANYPMGPCLGAALNVTTMSYGGSLDMGINLDRAAVTDSEGFMACLAESFADVISLA